MRKIIFILSIMLLPVIAFASGTAEAETQVSSPQGPVKGQLVYLEGDVEVNSRPAEIGMSIPYGARIVTGEFSYCEVVFESGNVFKVMESTIAEIKIDTSNPEIFIKQGAFGAVFNKLARLTKDEYFKVRTESVAAGVRGTSFFVKVVDADNTYVCACNGSLSLTDPSGSETVALESAHHKAVFFKNSGDKTVVESAPLLYHNDDDMEALASVIEAKIDWGDSSY